MSDIQKLSGTMVSPQIKDETGVLQINRKKILSYASALAAVVLVAYGLWFWVISTTVSTDNAYVGADTAEIGTSISGQIQQVYVQDTQQVKKGDLLALIDPSDAQIALAQAQAELAKTKRLYEQVVANSRSLSSEVIVSQDEINSVQAKVMQARVHMERLEGDLQRRMQLAQSGAVSKEEVATVQSSYKAAQADYAVAQTQLVQAESKFKAAQSNLDANDALVKGATQSSTPDVLAAQAVVDQALLNLKRTEIRAPIDGVVTRRKVQIGQRIAPGNALMLIVPIQQLYVDANFKESQLDQVHVGQKATLTSDLYGSDVVYQGTVVGFSGGTGAVFSLIPAQNATGNWIKVVQRLPVRIKLDPEQLKQHPLRVGLSMQAEIDLDSKTSS